MSNILAGTAPDGWLVYCSSGFRFHCMTWRRKLACVWAGLSAIFDRVDRCSFCETRSISLYLLCPWRRVCTGQVHRRMNHLKISHVKLNVLGLSGEGAIWEQLLLVDLLRYVERVFFLPLLLKCGLIIVIFHIGMIEVVIAYDRSCWNILRIFLMVLEIIAPRHLFILDGLIVLGCERTFLCVVVCLYRYCTILLG